MLKPTVFIGTLFFAVILTPASAAAEAVSKLSIPEFVRRHTSRALPARWKHRAAEISRAILEESRRYRFDPLLVVALIHTESRFRPNARGRFGEVGLVQIKPSTARWITHRHITRNQLFDPRLNIHVGLMYLSHLRSEAGHLYLSAYNRGLEGALRRKNEVLKPEDYASRVRSKHRAITREASGAVLTSL